MQNLFHVRTKVEIETRRRIMVSIWAYAYEFENVSLVDDHRFDAECRRIDPAVKTNRPDLDFFFATQFQPDTGMWIRHYPELDKIKSLYERQYKCMQ